MTSPTVGDLTARLRFYYDNDPLDFKKTGKGVVIVEDGVANVPLPTGPQGPMGELTVADRTLVRRAIVSAEELEKAAEAAEASATESASYASSSKNYRDAAQTASAEAQAANSSAASEKAAAQTASKKAQTAQTAAEAALASALSEADRAASERRTAQDAAEDATALRDGAKAHREAAKVSEDNAAASAASAKTDYTTLSALANDLDEDLQTALAAVEASRGIEAALRALMADTEAWNDVQTALEAVDADISAAMQQVKDDILGGVGPAFDTLLELAEAFGENRDAIVEITDQLAKKAEKGHTHTSADITNATSVLHGNYPDRVVKTRDDGQIYVYTSTVTKGHSVANKEYVDQEAAKKADKAHTHTIANVSGLQTALDGKAPESHIHAIKDVDGLEAQLASRSAEGHKHVANDVTDLAGIIESEILTAQRSFRTKLRKVSTSTSYWEPQDLPRSLRTGNRWRVALPYGTWRVRVLNAAGHSVRSAVNGGSYSTKPVDEDTHERRVVSDGSDWLLFSSPNSDPAVGDEVDLYIFEEDPEKADREHTHTSADITNTTGYFGSELSANKVVVTGGDGQLHASRHPVAGNHLTRKSYVDQEVGKKADQGHTHGSSEITDTVYRAGTTAAAQKVISASGTGRLYYDRKPAATDELANKEYVDREVEARTPRVEVVTSLPSSPDASTVYVVVGND